MMTSSVGHPELTLHQTGATSLYTCRWTVESTFGSLKDRGFDLERTGVTDQRRLERLFGLMSLAWLSGLQVGMWRHAVNPIWVLAHGRKAMSLVRYGSDYLRHVLRWPEALPELPARLMHAFLAPGAHRTGVAGY